MQGEYQWATELTRNRAQKKKKEVWEIKQIAVQWMSHGHKWL